MKLTIIDNIDEGKKYSARFDVENCLKNYPSIPNLELKIHIMGKDKFDLPALMETDKFLLSGSIKSVYEEFFWKKDLERLMEEIIRKQTATLAVCFSAQFLAQMLGGRVVKNPNGRELGAVKINLTEDGKKQEFLKDMDGKYFIESHKDYIESLPEATGVKHLAFNENSPFQAFSYGNILATQFHPDMPLETVSMLLNTRENELRQEGFFNENKKPDQVFAELKKGIEGFVVLHRFLSD